VDSVLRGYAKFFEEFWGRVAPFRFAHPRLTAIIWDFPAKNPQISLRETSDNRECYIQ